MSNDKKIQGLYGRFTLVGELNFKEEKLYEIKQSKDNKWKFVNSNFGVKTEEGNYVYCELKGMYSLNGNNVIKTKGLDNKDLKVDFSERLNPVIINQVASYRKTKINLIDSEENNGQSFISNYDAVPYFAENAKSKSKSRVHVEGNIVINRYMDKQGNMKTVKKYEAQNIRLAKEDEVNKAEAQIPFIIGEYTWDDTDFSEENKKVSINTHMTYYDNVRKEVMFAPVNFILDVNYLIEKSGGKMTPELEEKLIPIYKEYFEVEEGKYLETTWKGDIFSGTTKAEITEDDLNDNQKFQIMAGIITKEEVFEEMGRAMNGNKIDEIKLIRPMPVYKGETSKETDYVLEDFNSKENSVESKEIFNPQNIEVEKEVKADVMSQLFGAI